MGQDIVKGPKTSKTASILNVTETNTVKKRMLFNGTRYSNMVK